ncbi:hypothetical protein MesoLjLb_33710 [Mesorhizobium sp. L-8-3]|nr:hypothetical protein MesoLjLb_33710 [Mesorhizobium sp. L-8-3]
MVSVPSHPRSYDARPARPHRQREQVVESDEKYIGGKEKNRAYAKKDPTKHAVVALVDRDDNSYSFHAANAKADTLRETINKVADAKSHLVTDELLSYAPIGKEFAGHTTVNHSADEYVRLGGLLTSTRTNAGSAL